MALGLNRDLRGKPTGVRAGEWSLVLFSAPLAFAILVFGGPFERWVRRRWPHTERSGDN